MAPARPRFAFVTFTRVFDSTIQQEFATLPQLVQMFRRFELRPQTQQRLDKELRRIDAAEKAWNAGEEHGGAAWRELSRAAADSEADGSDKDAAVAAKLATLRKHVAAAAKRDLHLWSPALYRDGAKRGKEGVVHLSCLVMDYDAGALISEATATWRPWFHMLHTTWTHSEERPRFRVVVPLASPVLAEDWAAVGQWAEERTHGRIDPTGKSISSTFALPAIRSADAPCFSLCQPGELLDLVVEGVVQRFAAPSDRPYTADAHSIIGGFEGKSYVEAPKVAAPVDDPFETQDFWDGFHGMGAPHEDSGGAGSHGEHSDVDGSRKSIEELRRAAAKSVAPSGGSIGSQELFDELAAMRELLEQARRSDFVDALERLSTLHTNGALTDDEFAQAKAKLLRDDD